jgi:thioredoxin-like negative regulator of GroEL
LWLHEKDLSAAFAALGQSLTLVPSNTSNRLKLAQLRLIAGERDQARQLLLELRGERLSMEERKTLDELLAGLGMLETKPALE